MTTYMLNRLTSVFFQTIRSQNRSFFYWVTVIFNRVDADRIKEIGPDRACAEWLLRNGAFVRWKNFSEQLTDYNALPSHGNYYIEAIEANNAGICDVGFPHFEGCKYIKDLKFKECRYINNDALPHLSLLQDSLTNLEIIRCKSIDDNGLRELKILKNLKQLKIKGLPAVTNDIIYKELTEALPNCKIDIE
ncbi:ATP synthase subunit s, mitochondrial [Apis mellifera carnica]|uniref:ATP synthase subunit s, mitochondrial n=1 Tax=Apis mellifera TaxID=7460 RepID=A0A7M7FZ17_APIME|nr:ATP synthase subunit s, mitochondrial [Apis mellifera]KAG9430698.1 ATP synthase subunit s, mitochondrial [Apis mellifera carnica]|eukprot:XP_001122185.1 ATP synthase subunit s, mitochondrial [Apis mellifera]